MNSLSEKEALAAEYVLGTLDKNEREQVDAALKSDAELAQLIDDWERRLSPLVASIDNMIPSAELFTLIEARLNKAQISAQYSTTTIPGELLVLRQKVARWRAAAIATATLAAGLTGFILLRGPTALPQPQQFVAVFQQDDQQPVFLMAVNLETRQLLVRPISAEGHPGKTYQLWIKSDKIGPAPQSLGLVSSTTQPTQKQLTNYDPAILQTATFGISLEPEGGSPTGLPTGPAIHGKLYPSSI
jgi:anti-sigma-K factor RskA